MPSLLIDIEARFAAFQDSLDRVSRDVSRQVRGMEKAFATLGSSIGGIAGLLGAGSVAAAVSSIVRSMADLDDAAEKSGASVESLSSLLNTLAPTGVTLEQISDVAAKLTKSMAEAGKESSRAGEAFAKLGIQVRDGGGNLRSIDDVLTEVATALNQYADGTNKVAIAQALLGKSGADYLPLLKDLATRQRESSSVTTEQAAAAEALANSWRSLGTETRALAQVFAGPLVQSLLDIVQRFNDARNAGAGFIDTLTTGLFGDSPEKITQGIDTAVKRLADLRARVDAVQSGKGSTSDIIYFDALQKKVRETEGFMIALLKQYDRFGLAQRSLEGQGARAFLLGEGYGPKPDAPSLTGDDKATKRQAISDGAKLVQQLEDRVFSSLKLTETEKLMSEIARGRISFDTEAQRQRAVYAAQQVDSITKIIDASKQESDQAIRRIRIYEEREAAESAAAEAAEAAAAAQVQSYIDLISPADKYLKQLREIAKLEEEGRLAASQADDARAAIVAQIDALNTQVEATNELRSVAEDLGLTFSSAFEDAVIQGENLRGVLQGIAQDILKITLRKAITEPLAGFVTGGLESLFSGGGGVTNIGAPINPNVTLPDVLRGGGMAPVPKEIVQNFDLRNSAVSEDMIRTAAAQGAALAKTSIYDDRARGSLAFG